MIDGMRKLGYDVIGYDYRSHDNFKNDLLDIVAGKRPEFVFTLKGERLSPQSVADFRQQGCRTILWFEHSGIEDWMLPLALAHDYVFTNTEDTKRFLAENGVKNIKWVHQGFSPEFFGINGQESHARSSSYYAEAAMIGSMGYPIYKKRCELVTFLRKNSVDIKWWGPHLSRKWKNIPYFLGGIHRAWSGKEAYMKDFADVIRNIKIFIGQDADTEISGLAVSNRLFAVTGCGGFYLGRKTPGIEALFEIGKEVDVFESSDELLEKVRFYLENDTIRERIASAGQQKVLTQYTYKQQMAKIFDWVKKHSEYH
jgi:hypothetical protein